MASSSRFAVHVTPNLGPLTSIWTPPTSCLNTQTYYDNLNWSGPGLLGERPAPECYPAGFAPNTVYSPGLCPSGWQYRGVPSNGKGWTTTFVSTLTVRKCCPGTMMQWEESPGEWCSGYLPSSTLYTLWSTGSSISAGKLVTTSWSTNADLWAIPILVAWQATDTEIFTLLPATERPSTTSASPGAISTIAPTATSTSSDNSSKGGLSTGAKAGIGVGVALGVVLIALIAGFWFWLYRRNKKTTGYRPNRIEMKSPTYQGQSPGNGYQSPDSYQSPELRYSDPSRSANIVLRPQEVNELPGSAESRPY